jgi:hypothetical protein
VVVDVVRDPDRDSPLGRGEERSEHEPSGVRLEADVVERDVEALPGGREEGGDPACDVGGLLAAVGERLEPDRRLGRDGLGQEALPGEVACARFCLRRRIGRADVETWETTDRTLQRAVDGPGTRVSS